MRNLAPLLLIVSGCITEPGLFIDKTGAGNGRVRSDPAGIDCGEQCGALVTGPVTLVATPDSGSVFVGWDGGGCSGTEPCTLDVVDDTSIGAKFAFVYHTLTITPDPHGRVDSLDILCGEDCTAIYRTGTTVKLNATPAYDYLFVEWSDGAVTNPHLITIDESVTFAAVYELRSSVEVSIQGLGVGRVTSTPLGITCARLSGPCAAPFRAGTVVTLNAEPDPGSSFTGWQGCTPVENMPASCLVEATGENVVVAGFTMP